MKEHPQLPRRPGRGSNPLAIRMPKRPVNYNRQRVAMTTVNKTQLRSTFLSALFCRPSPIQPTRFPRSTLEKRQSRSCSQHQTAEQANYVRFWKANTVAKTNATKQLSAFPALISNQLFCSAGQLKEQRPKHSWTVNRNNNNKILPFQWSTSRSLIT